MTQIIRGNWPFFASGVVVAALADTPLGLILGGLAIIATNTAIYVIARRDARGETA